jgi:hypothetical protein
MALLLVAGCGDGIEKVSVVAVKGKLYVDDKPHGPATMVLYPIPAGEDDQRPAVSGEVTADGSFTLTTYDAGDGAPPGEYTVQLQGTSASSGSVDPAEMMAAAAGGTAVEQTTIEIPAAGSENLEVRLKSAGQPGGTTGGGSLLGQ